MKRRCRVCMIVPEASVKGGIAAVVNGYRGSSLERKYHIGYVESYRDGTRWQKFGKAVSGYCTLFRRMLMDRPDIVHVHSSFGPSFYRKIPFIYMSCLFGVPVINHIHGAEFDRFYEQASQAKKRLIARVYGRCTRLIVLSEEWKERIAPIVPDTHIDVLENFCLIPKEPYDQGRNRQQVLFMGELGTRKGCYDIPDIWKRVLFKAPSAKLVMAGDGELEAVRKAFEKKGISSGVDFPGWVRQGEKDRLLQESAVFLFPSYNEGMPMVILEAMSYGLGVVTTNVGGIPNLVWSGENGFIRKPGDTEGLAEDVVRLLNDPALCIRTGKKARQTVAKDYDDERHRARLNEIYESVLRETNARESK